MYKTALSESLYSKWNHSVFPLCQAASFPDKPAPSRQNNEEFRCGIVLIKDTNLPLETIPTDLTGENRLLFARNKWLICHSESKPATRGGCIGLIGKNLEI